MMLTIGDRARKVGGSYQATGEIRALFRTRAGQDRAVFEFDSPPGMLHLFNLDQLQPMTETRAAYSVDIYGVPSDRAVAAVRAKLLQRSQVGFKKYGCTTDRTDLGVLDWMRHALEEQLDNAVYLQRAIFDLELEISDGK